MSNTQSLVLNIRKDYTEYKKQLLLILCALWGTSAAMGALLGFNHSGGGITELIMFSVFYTIFALVVASAAFPELKEKTGRISYIMTPASASDKFVTRLIVVVPLVAIAVIIAYYIGDIARILTAMLFHNDGGPGSNYRHIVDPFMLVRNLGWEETLSSIIGFLFIQGIFFVGSVYWPRYSFFKTVLIIIAFQIAVLSLFSIVAVNDIGFLDTLDNISVGLWAYYVPVTILTAGCYYLVYHKIKRMEVVDRKLF